MPADGRPPAPPPISRSPHAATLPPGSAVQGKNVEGQRPPHPATVVQPRRAPHPGTGIVEQTPHPATVQRKEAPFGIPKELPPHPARPSRGSAAQGKSVEGQRPPHPATVVQARRAPHPATVQLKAAPFGIVRAMPSRPGTVLQPMDLFGDDDVSFGESVDDDDGPEPEHDYDEFWTKLQGLDRSQQITNIHLEIPLITIKKPCAVAVSARAENDATSFLLELQSTGKKKQVYWLPWVAGSAMEVKRAVFEGPKTGCDYFFTTQLDGCTFTITDDAVMHIAHDYKGGPQKAEKNRTVIAHHMPSAYQGSDTKRRGFAFGVRKSKGWVYYLGSGLDGQNCSELIRVLADEHPYGSPEHGPIM